jgi:multidrug efflux pump subunit AcrA (membrane-fusion protein)
MPTTKILHLACLLAALAISGCSASNGSDDEAPQGGSGGAPSKADVGFIEVRPIVIKQTNPLPGRVLAFEEAEIRPQVNGIVLERLFDEGSYVEEGQPLYQIDPAVYQAELELAEAELENAEARLRNANLRYERFEQLVKNNTVSQQQFDDAEAELNQSRAAISLAEAKVRRAQINLDYTQVRSPISGYIGPSAVTRGALLTALQPLPLATVRQLDPVYVDLSQMRPRLAAYKSACCERERKEKPRRPMRSLYIWEIPMRLILNWAHSKRPILPSTRGPVRSGCGRLFRTRIAFCFRACSSAPQSMRWAKHGNYWSPRKAS